jgi:Rieske Fe-S protein
MIINRLNSKIATFCLFSTIGFLMLTCKGVDDDVIPYVKIDINPININDPTYWDFMHENFGCILIENTGYEGNGIVLYKAGENEFKAYDATCTYEIKEGCSMVINDSTFYGNLRCSCCGSKFDLNNYGYPAKGQARYPLKSYRVSFDGTYIYIRN